MALYAKVWKKIESPVVGYLDESILEEIIVFLLGKKALRGGSEVSKTARMREGMLASEGLNWT